MSKTQQTLGAEGYERYRRYTLEKESAGSGGYQAENQFGFIGGYQMGAPALKDAGLVKAGAPNNNSALNNSIWWNDPPGSKQAFLNNPAIQDKAFSAYTDRNFDSLKRGSNAAINDNTPPEKVAGYLGAAHLVGAGAVKADPSLSKQDGNGVSALSRYQGASAAISGKTPLPPPTSAKSGTAPSAGIAPREQAFTGEGVTLEGSSFGSEVIISYFPQQQVNIPLPIENSLSDYASFNYIFTLSSLSPAQVNFPEDSYRQGRLGNIVLRSGGSGDLSPSLAVTTPDNFSGQYEYFIEDLTHELLMSFNRKTKGSNATVFEFTVTEPYSMGQFLQALQISALENGYKTGYIGTPFLLTLEFVGFTDSGNAEKIPNSTRYFPIRITGAEMSVNASGSKYRVSAIAWNEIAMNDSASLFKSDIGISGGTVQEILQSGEFSLQTVLNKRLQELASKDSGATLPDEIIIVFPNAPDAQATPEPDNQTQDDSQSDDDASDTGEVPDVTVFSQDRGATQDPAEENAGIEQRIETRITVSRSSNNIRTQGTTSLNNIGLSNMDFNASQAGESTPIKPNDAAPDPGKPAVRKNIKWDATKRQFIFSQGTTIINAISNVVTTSKYCKDTADGVSKPDALGMVPWFRIESEVYINPSQQGNIGNQKSPFMLIYKVVPYLVHHSVFSDRKSPSKGIPELKQEAAKEYNYIYSGKNTEIISFDININTAFFTPATADGGKLADLANFAGAYAARLPDTVPQAVNNQPGELDQSQPPSQQGQDIKLKNDSGGSTAVDHRTVVAQIFQKALLESPVDLVTGDMVILGDPYYVADSGIGNFSNTGSGRFNITQDNAMDYQSGQPMVIVNFRTSVDYGQDGIMHFGQGELVQEFSGLYFVDLVKNDFLKGKFTQTLSLRRVINQATKPQTKELDAIRADITSSETLINEDGSVSNFRRNLETGDLYEAPPELFDDQGRALWNPNDPTTAKTVQGSSVVVTTKPLLDTVPREQTFNSDYPFP